MRTKSKTLMLALALLFSLVSCKERDKGTPTEEVQMPELFEVVTSDALSIAYSSDMVELLSLTDSLNPVCKINYGKLLNSPAILTWSYYGELSQMLVIDTGKDYADSTSAVSSVCSQAQDNGMQCKFYPPEEKDNGREHGFIVLTPSASQMKVAERHISEGRSVLDAPYFSEAYDLVAGEDDILILRGSGINRILPKDFLNDIFPKRSLRSFMTSIADWICLSRNSDGSISIQTVQGDAYSYFPNVLSSQPFGECRIGTILPKDIGFVLSFPMDITEYRAAYERYADASVRMTPYTRKLTELETETGVSPLDWEKEHNIRELALVVFGDKRIVVVRENKPHADSAVQDNPCRGFVKALYGNAFSVEDSHYKYSNGWMLIGKAEDVEEFSECIPTEKQEITHPIVRNCHTIIYSSGKTLLWDKKGIKIWNSNQ